MNPEQARQAIGETFRQKFDDIRFLNCIRNLVNQLDESKKQTWTLKKAAFEDYGVSSLSPGLPSPRGYPGSPVENVFQPQRGCVLRHAICRNPVGVDESIESFSQGSSFLATLG